MRDFSQLMVFTLDDQRYALALGRVERVIRAQAITALPGAPAGVQGAIDVQGTVMPVFDIRSRFGLPPRALRLGDQILLARTTTRAVGLCVDETQGVMACMPEQVLAAEQLLPDVAYVQGVLTLPDGLLLIHDLDTFLTQSEQQALDQALEHGA
ncbi:Chemotaxis protein CheW [Andreprevotia sp. IGB-42]|uniref:chemotaxis protein CheW n=1 Tax=Andreprevotia sp. IGB-42 TaxID=2497473 RepID=UPI00135AB432|nr:chemotaxis protein CheW [Andreprevotia sp. IGB-42]KAF0815335.1 Chemotaxis protein CheW [Andreprevotia sp. IGB-42]